MQKAKPNLLKRFFKSKVLVLLTLLAIAGIGFINTAKADDTYSFSTVYQYYMLDNRKDQVVDSAKADEKKVAWKSVANLGSGGVTGSFSYDDIVNSAPSGKGNDETAKQFVSMMATYSTFGYFSNRVQGFQSWGSYIGRFILMIVLSPFAIVMDFLDTLVPAMIKILAKLNVMTWLGEMITNQGFASDMTKALGITKAQFETFINILLTILASSILIALGLALRKGAGNVDQKHWRKFQGRLFSIIVLPLSIGFGAYLIQGITDLADKAPAVDPSFGTYLVDDRSWAYNYNFAPTGNSTKTSDIKRSKSGSYVDLSFDPYTEQGGERIKAINQDSSLLSDGVFKNTSMLIAYGMSQAFSATDYINFEGSADSLYKLNGSGGATYGSYYNYAQSMAKKKLLTDVDKSYYGSGAQMSDGSQEGSYKEAIDDYKTDKGNLNTSASTAWRDRYIYGAKTAGDMDKYYGKEPSQEMVQGAVGGRGRQTVLSDQSMFLVLSTIFDETGGRYYIAAPARGIKSAIGQFDSNRSDYYVVSMVGNPMFSTIGLITKPLIKLTVLIATLAALLSIGLLDMNLKPLMAWFKGATIGDIEYTSAYAIYAVGIAGTIILFIVMPALIIGVMELASRLIVEAIPELAKTTPSTPQGSLAFHGTTVIVNALFGVAFTFMYLKSKKFRIYLSSFFTWIWTWANEKGQALERQAAGVAGYNLGDKNKKRVKKNFDKFDKSDKVANDLKRAGAGFLQSKGIPVPSALQPKDENQNAPVASENEGSEEAEDTPNVNGINSANKKPKSADEIKRNGQYDRIDQDLDEVQSNPNTSPETVPVVLDAQQGVKDFKNSPTQKNLNVARDRLQALKEQLQAEGAPEDQIAAVDKAIDELNGVAKTYDLKTPPNKKVVKSKNAPLNKNANGVEGEDNGQSASQAPQKPQQSGKQATEVKSSKNVPAADNKSVKTKKSQVGNQDQPVKTQNVREADRVIDNTSKKAAEPVIKRSIQRTDTRSTEKGKGSKRTINVTDRIANNEVNKIQKPVINKKGVRMIRNNQLKPVVSALGSAGDDPKVQVALKNMQNSNNTSQLKKSIRQLQKGVRALDSKSKQSIDKKRLVKNLYDLQNSNFNKPKSK